MDRLSLALAQLDRLMNFFPRGDGKATFVFAVNTAALLLVGLNFPFGAVSAHALVAGTGLLSAVFLAISLVLLCKVFLPDLKSGDTKSAVYFGDISQYSLGEYRDRWRSITESELLEDVLCQVHRNSEILQAKFRHLQTAQILMLVGVGLWLIFIAGIAASGIPIKWGP